MDEALKLMINFLALNAAVSNPSLFFLCSIAGLNHALHNIVSKAVLEVFRPNLLEVWGQNAAGNGNQLKTIAAKNLMLYNSTSGLQILN